MGFLAWAILGALSTILLMYYHYEKGLPLAPRTLLYPVFGQYALEGILGVVIDASAIIAVVAGTVGPIGFWVCKWVMAWSHCWAGQIRLIINH